MEDCRKRRSARKRSTAAVAGTASKGSVSQPKRSTERNPKLKIEDCRKRRRTARKRRTAAVAGSATKRSVSPDGGDLAHEDLEQTCSHI